MREIIRTMVLILGVAAAALGLAGLLQTRTADAASTTAFTVPTGSTSLETIACNAGVSPCAIGATSTTVLNANAGRIQCLIQNVGTTDFYCIQGTGTVTTSNMHFILKAASAANKGDGGSFSCSQGPAIWRGVIVCLGSAASGTLTASGATAAGF